MPPIPHRVQVQHHPGATLQDIENEPDWGRGHQHRVGFVNGQDRVPGLTHAGDEHEDDSDPHDELSIEDARKRYEKLRDDEEKGKLVNFRDVINAQKDFHLVRPGVHSQGWRYVLNAEESWIKNVEKWPANIERREKEQEAKKKKQERGPSENGTPQKLENGQGKDQDVPQEHEWKRKNGDNKHHDAYAGSPGSDADAEESSGDNSVKSEYEKLREKYSPQEISLLRSLQHERDYIYTLQQNDGKMKSPVPHQHPLVSIDEADQFAPDNWIPRSSNLIRLTGKVCSP
ncbi:hypothetical protein QTJ16_000538 [Diplocarpon rosae]|uniref:Uncharacterized protein n=1 Tax=Diplocarpon rosae TaxID=946125 RepID=A0AAD9WGV6_9HELO|nr:hypothetical protein QTJ16_000538 [Diplocarpon rosae]